MRKLILAALAASAAMAAPAAAQSIVTGTVTINGNVPSKCTVTTGTPGSSFGATVDMGELSDTDLTLKSSTALETAFGSGVTAGSLSARVVCTTADANITVAATELTTAGSPTAGYANTVHYKANVAVTKVSGTTTYSDDTVLGGGAATALGSRLDATVANNIVISTSDWRTSVANNEVLFQGNYSGQIVVTIAPI